MDIEITNIQHFCIDDGPGIRTVVFFKGCNLACIWCHNPETQKTGTEYFYYPQRCIQCGKCYSVCEQEQRWATSCKRCGRCADICPSLAIEAVGKHCTFEEITAELLEDVDLYKISGGGVTFSGGEPMLQRKALQDLVQFCAGHCIHTAIETAGCWPFSWIEPFLSKLDLVFCDLKTLDNEKHLAYTGQSNHQIISNLRSLSKEAKELVIRIPVIHGFNHTELNSMADFVTNLPRTVKVELLPYHDICRTKYAALRRQYIAEGTFRAPTEDEMSVYRSLFN